MSMMNTDMKKIAASTSSTIAYLLLSTTAFAQTSVDPCPPKGSGVEGQDGFNRLCSAVNPSQIGDIIGKVIVFALIAAALIALFFLIWGGIKWILSGGDKAKVEAARNTLIAAIVGLIITFLAFFLLQIVFNFFGLGGISSLTLPSL